MKVLKHIIISAVALCVLTTSAMALEPQKKDPKPPPPKEGQKVPKAEKPPPPRNSDAGKGNSGNRGGDSKREKP